MTHAIIGCGSIGQRHLKNLHFLGERDFVAIDPVKERRDKMAKDYNAEPLPEFKESIAKEVDVAFVTLPNSRHIEMALIAARAKCHLFIEKPLSVSMEGVNELIEKTNSNNKVGFVGSNWKFHPSFRKMKSLLEEKVIGRVLTARCISGQYLPDWHPWEDYRHMYSAKKDLGGGVIFDSHELDYLSWFLGRVNDLSCFSGKVSDLEIETEDTASLLLRFESGVIAQVHLDYLQRAYQRRYEFCGSEGTIIWDVNDKAIKLYRANNKSWKTVFETPKDYENNTMYVEELKHFLLCIHGKSKPITPLEKGREVLDIMMAAHRSNKLKRVVNLHEETMQ